MANVTTEIPAGMRPWMRPNDVIVREWVTLYFAETKVSNFSLRPKSKGKGSPHSITEHGVLSRGSWGPVDILVAATVLAAYSVFRLPV